MHKHEYQRRILSILRGDEDFLVKLFKSLTDDKIPLIENKESLRAFLIELYLADAKSKNIEIIDDDFAIEVKRYSQKHSSLMVLIKNGIKISLDEIVEQMYWWLKDFVYSEFKDLILYLVQIQPLEVRLESMQSIIYKAIDNKDFDFVKQLINLSDQNNLKIIDESFVKKFRPYNCPYSLILILVKKGMKFSLDQLRRASELKDNEYDDYKNLVLLMVQDEIMQTNQESLRSIFAEALDKDDVEFAEKLFDRIDKSSYCEILSYGEFPKLALEWFAKKLLDNELEQKAVDNLVATSIRSDLWGICDMVMQRYPAFDLIDIVANHYIVINQNIIDQILKRVDQDKHFELAQKILKKIVKFRNQVDLETISYLIAKFPQLTINDLFKELESDKFNRIYDIGPDLLILLLNNSPADLISLELAQKIFDFALLIGGVEDNSLEPDPRKQKYLELGKIILQKKPFLSYHQAIYCEIESYDDENTSLQGLINKIPEEQITDDFKANILAKAIKTSNLNKLQIINNFLEANAVFIDYLAQLRAIRSIDVKSEYYKYLFGKVSFIPKELAQELLQKIFERYSSCQENIELLELLISKTDETILDYNKLINTNHVVYHFDRLKWLLGKLKTISNQDAEKLIKSLVRIASDSYTDKDYCAIMQLIIDRTEGLELTQFLQEIRHSELLKFFLARIDRKITDPDLSQKLLIFAIGKKDENLFQIIEAKLAAINYSLLLNFAVNDHEGEVDLKMLRVLLSREVDVNLKHCGGGYRSREAVYPLEFYSQHDEAIGLLIEHGAKLSLIDSEQYGDQKYSHPQRAIIKYLCKNLNYSYLEEYLSQLLDEDFKRAAVKLIFDQAIDLDNQKLLQLVIDHGFDVNSKADNYYPLDDAVSWNKLKVAEFLVKMKASSSENLVSNLISKKYNSLLEIVCQNDYDYNRLTDYFGSEKYYPLQIALMDKNEGAAKILLKYLTIDQVKEIEGKLQSSLLSTAIYFKQEEVALLILDKLGSDFKIKNEYNILQSACESGMLDLIKKLHKLRNLDINCRNLYSQTILHIVVQSNKNPDIVENIIGMIADINAFDRNGATALHIAATSGNKEIFQLLINRGANPSLRDNKGNNVYYSALYHDNLDKLDIPFDYFPFELSVYQQLLSYIKKQPEAQYIDPLHFGSMAAKFACLFDDQIELESYITKHTSNSEHPIHDLSIFSLPEGKWDKEAWKELAINHGLKLTKYLFLAPEIEKNLGRVPNDLAEVESQARAIKYEKADQNPKMAEIFHENMIPGYVFDMMLSHKTKTVDHIPDIFIEGDKQQQSDSPDTAASFDHSRCYMKKLPKDDLRGFILGNKTNCCQYVGSEGHNCAVHGMTSAYGGFYVIFKRGKKGRCDNLEEWLKNLEVSTSKDQFLNTFKEKSLKNKYRGIIESIEKDFEVKNAKKASFDEIREVLKKDFEQELEGEIIAQSWVWISQNQSLVLDSWERLSGEYDALFKPFMKKLAEEILTKNPNIKKILIGSGGCTPWGTGLVEVKDPEKPVDYIDYRDSNSQYLIAQTLQLSASPNPVIKVNAAINISNQRIHELEVHFFFGSKNLKNLEQIQKNWRDYLVSKKDSEQLVALQ